MLLHAAVVFIYFSTSTERSNEERRRRKRCWTTYPFSHDIGTWHAGVWSAAAVCCYHASIDCCVVFPDLWCVFACLCSRAICSSRCSTCTFLPGSTFFTCYVMISCLVPSACHPLISRSSLKPYYPFSQSRDRIKCGTIFSLPHPQHPPASTILAHTLGNPSHDQRLMSYTSTRLSRSRVEARWNSEGRVV